VEAIAEPPEPTRRTEPIWLLKGALQRARTTLTTRLPARDRERAPLPRSPHERELVGRFADAVESGDVDGVVSLLTDDAWLTMPPQPFEYQGHAAITRLAVRTTLNGDVVQSGSLGDLVFGVEAIVAYASSFSTLSPGDIIALGTPGGIGFRRDPPVYLAPGDRLSVEMVGHAEPVNRIVDDRTAA
jgi:hypothetical protein